MYIILLFFFCLVVYVVVQFYSYDKIKCEKHGFLTNTPIYVYANTSHYIIAYNTRERIIKTVLVQNTTYKALGI